MTVLSQFFAGSTSGAAGSVGTGNFFMFGTTGSVTLPSTTKYVAYAALGAGGGSVRNACCATGSCNSVCTCGSAGGGFSANWGDHAPGTTTTVCVTVGAGPGGTSCVTGLLPGNISATGGGNGSACSYARGVGSGGKINTCGGFGGCATAIGCDNGSSQWSGAWVLMTGAGAGGMYGSGGSAAIIAGGRCSDSGTGLYPCIFCNGNLTCVNCVSWCAFNCNTLFAGGGGGFGSGGGGGAGAMAIGNCFNCIGGTGFCLLCMNGNPGEGGSPGTASFGGAGLGGVAAGAAANNVYAQSVTPAIYLDGGKKYSFAMSMLSTAGGGGYTEAIQGLGCRGPTQAGFGGGGSGFAPAGFGGGAGMTVCGVGVNACGVRAGCGGGGMSQAFSCSSVCSTCCTDPGNGFGIVEYWT